MNLLFITKKILSIKFNIFNIAKLIELKFCVRNAVRSLILYKKINYYVNNKII